LGAELQAASGNGLNDAFLAVLEAALLTERKIIIVVSIAILSTLGLAVVTVAIRLAAPITAVAAITIATITVA